MMAKARIAVIGAGLMGHGIAQVFALAGHDVSIQDSVAANLDSAKARRPTSPKLCARPITWSRPCSKICR